MIATINDETKTITMVVGSDVYKYYHPVGDCLYYTYDDDTQIEINIETLKTALKMISAMKDYLSGD